MKSLRFLLLGLCALLVAATQSAVAANTSASWIFAGHDLSNSRTQPAETKINADNAARLAVKWTFHTHGDVSATPTVANGVVYFPDWGGYINALNASTGALIWQRAVSSYAGETAGAVSRTSPAIYGNEIIFGDNFGTAQSNGAHVLAVNATTGKLLWNVKVDTNPAAIITGNPVVADGMIIVGVSSNEEADTTAVPNYPCCSFRGKVVALNPSTGATIWQRYTVPSNTGIADDDSNTPCTSAGTGSGPTGCGYTGGAVWDTPAVDTKAGMVFVGTGNNYTTPDAATACEQNALANNLSDASCTAPDDYFDSTLALNLKDGSVVWDHKVEGWDAWTVACFSQPLGVTWCPSPSSPDYDFGGSGPNLITLKGPKGTTQTVVGIGQKSGVYWAFDELTGKTLWSKLVGPGSALGGIEWGTAYDGKRIYVPIADFYGIPYTLADGATDYAGSWAAIDPTTGAFDWQVGVPNGGLAEGAVSEANGVVYAGSTASSTDGSVPNMFAIDAATGKVLWSYPAVGSVNSAPAIVDGTVYWGTGYSHIVFQGGNDTFYAFSVNGQ